MEVNLLFAPSMQFLQMLILRLTEQANFRVPTQEMLVAMRPTQNPLVLPLISVSLL